MVHWNLAKKRRIYALQAGLLILAVAVFSFIDDYQGQASDDLFQIVERHELPLKELSGFALQRDAAGAELLVAVGDKAAKIVVFDPTSKAISKMKFSDQLLEKFTLCSNVHSQTCNKLRKKITSDWEAVAVDADGRYYLLQEHSQAIVVLSPDAKTIERVINFDIMAAHHQNVQRTSLKFKTNSLGEGLVLSGENFLIAKEMYPLSIIEISPSEGVSHGFPAATPVAEGSQTQQFRQTYHTVASWELAGHSKCDFSELTRHGDRLLALSQKCRKLLVFDELPPGGGSITPTRTYKLPSEIRSPEALAVLSDGRIAIGSDVKKQKTNLYILESSQAAGFK